MLNRSNVVTEVILMSTQLLPMQLPEGRNGSNSAALSRVRYVHFGPFHLDLKKEELLKEGARIKLQGKVYQALLALLQKSGELVTRQELRMQLWPSDTYVNFDANLNTTVNKLRQILGDSPEQPAFVETIPRKGYSFVAKIEFADRPPAPPAPRTGELPPVAADRPHAEDKAPFFRTVLLSRWFTVGFVTLVIASMLFGAALALYAHR
jgi:DNA-binding winged helix-turn-helix (wHTH) protein